MSDAFFVPSNERARGLAFELHEAHQEIKKWKQIASYLADCHAATLEGLPKSAAKSQRRRMINICDKAALWLGGGAFTEVISHLGPEAELESTEQRCVKSAAKYGTQSA